MTRKSPAAQDIAPLIESLPEDIQALARSLAALIARNHPEMVPRVRLGWGGYTYHHPRAGYVCGLFPHKDRVSLLFEHGRELADPHGLLEGTQKRIRYIRIRPGDDLPEGAISDYIAEAIALRW
jgi:hypothetical protein